MDEVFYQAGSSPHTRGALVDLHLCVPPGRIIPAYAGSTAAPRHSSRASNNHPCIRGEHGAPWSMVTGARGSSPHTRGALLSLFFPLTPTRIIPAYAGSTQCAGIRLGERSGSSPHTRGARIHAAARRWPSDHPRIRGEHRQEGRRQGLVWGSSPHTRGARRPVGSRGLPDRIIPAYAGSTATKAKGRPFGRDHPRIRGEHASRPVLCGVSGGSSPHTRGARIRGSG